MLDCTEMDEPKYTKDFDGWHPRKMELNALLGTTTPFYHEREIWWCALGVNIGTEQDGIGHNFDRPVLIIRGFNREQFFGVALTGNRKENSKWHIYIGQIGGEGEGSVILSQVRTIDARRLIRKMATLDEGTFKRVVDGLKGALFPQ